MGLWGGRDGHSSSEEKKKEGRGEKEIPVFEHNLFMVSPVPYMGLSTEGLST